MTSRWVAEDLVLLRSLLHLSLVGGRAGRRRMADLPVYGIWYSIVLCDIGNSCLVDDS
jgi:hypothetical protein